MNTSAMEDVQHNHPITGDPGYCFFQKIYLAWRPRLVPFHRGGAPLGPAELLPHCVFMSCPLGRSRRLIPPQLGVVAILAGLSCSLCPSSPSRLRRNIDSKTALENSYRRQEARAGWGGTVVPPPL